MSEDIGRLLTAMVTPFDDAGRVDYEGAQRLARALLASGSDGVIVCGTTGEFSTTTEEENLKLYAAVKMAIGNDGSVVANTGGNNTAESVTMTKQAEDLGVDGVMAVVPYYNKPPQEGLYQHFKSIANATSLPLIVYNVPSRTSQNLSAETTIRLSYIDNVVGIKEASGDMDQVSQIIQGAKPGFRVWSGNDNDTFAIMAMGGYGVISVVSHLVGSQIKTMMEHIRNGKLDLAAADHHRLHPLFKALFIVANPIPVKYALNKAGFPVGEPRLPLVPPDAGTAAAIDGVVERYSIDLPIKTTL